MWQFRKPGSRTIRNFLTGEPFELVPVDDQFRILSEHYAQVADVCNQPLVYKMLFEPGRQGKPYTTEDAQRFLRWAQEGWREGTHFVFLLLHADGSIVGAVDIKSDDLESAEVGYWMSAHHPGVMTNALAELTQIAREAGYKELFAQVKEENVRSADVLRRVGFECAETFLRDGKTYQRFVLRL